MSKGFLLEKEMLDIFSSMEPGSANQVAEVVCNLGLGEKVITKKLFIKNIASIKNLLGSDETFNILIEFFPELKNNSFEEKIDIKCSNDLNSDKTGKVKLLYAPAFSQRKIEVKDFVKHFNYRYESIRNFLEKRNFENLTSIRKIGFNKSNYTIIVTILNKRVTKNKNIFLEVEDLTGKSLVLINQNKKDLFEKAKSLLVDDIVAIDVNGTSDMLFANEIYYPEAGLEEKRYSEFDEYVAFVSDFHAGSTMFLEKNLVRFVKWLNGVEGDEGQRELAKKVKYLFINGDNIDGVNHYPGQEKHLEALTSLGQYSKVEEILKLVRDDIKIIISPGQHDSVWVGEPQPIISEKYAPGLHKMKNVYLVPNPSLVEIDGGFKILMYHGASINSFIDEIPEIRTKYSHNNPTRVVKEMLKRRHLAPMHGMVDYIPCENSDPLVIHEVPDIITTGDQHRAEISMYNKILLIASSCWQSITPFEEKVGNNPDPCKVPLFNLKTREIKILDFSDESREIENSLKEVNREEQKDAKTES